MADESMDVDGFGGAAVDDDVVIVGGSGGAPDTSGGVAYMDDDLDLDDDDDDEDDDAPLLAPRMKAARVTPKSSLKSNKVKITSKTTSVIKSEDDYQPGDYQLRACGKSSEQKEFIIAKFRDGLPQMTHAQDETVHVSLFRDGERTVDKRLQGLLKDKKSKTFLTSYRGQRREIRRQKQGFATIRERLLKDWKLEIAPKSVRDKLNHEHQLRINRRLKSGLTKGMDLDFNDKDIDEEEEDDDDNDDNDDNDNDNDNDDNNNEEGKNYHINKNNQNGTNHNKDTVMKGDNNNNEEDEVTLKELKKLVKKYTGQFDGRTSTSKFAFMIVNEKTKMIDVIPVSDTSMFVFRSDQKATAKTAEQVEKIHKKLKNKRLKDDRLAHFAASANAKSTEREILMGDRKAIENIPNAYNAGISGGSNNVEISEEDLGEDFDFEQEFDNDDVLLVDKEDIPKVAKSIPMDIAKQTNDLQKFLNKNAPKDEDEQAEQAKKEENKEKDKKSTGKEEAKEIKEEKTVVVNTVSSSVPAPRSNSSVAAADNVQNSPPVMSSPSQLSSSPNGTNNRPRHSSPSSASNGRMTPQISDVSHLLPPSGELPTADHVRAVLREVLRLQGKSEMDFRKAMRYFEKKTSDQKKNLVNLIRQVAHVRKDESSGSLVVSLRQQ